MLGTTTKLAHKLHFEKQYPIDASAQVNRRELQSICEVPKNAMRQATCSSTTSSGGEQFYRTPSLASQTSTNSDAGLSETNSDTSNRPFRVQLWRKLHATKLSKQSSTAGLDDSNISSDTLSSEVPEIQIPQLVPTESSSTIKSTASDPASPLWGTAEGISAEQSDIALERRLQAITIHGLMKKQALLNEANGDSALWRGTHRIHRKNYLKHVSPSTQTTGQNEKQALAPLALGCDPTEPQLVLKALPACNNVTPVLRFPAHTQENVRSVPNAFQQHAGLRQSTPVPRSVTLTTPACTAVMNKYNAFKEFGQAAVVDQHTKHDFGKT